MSMLLSSSVSKLLRRQPLLQQQQILQIRNFSTDNTNNNDNDNDDDDDDDDDEGDEISLNLEETEDNFPRLGWSPGSFGTRALQPSRKRKLDQAVGRSGKPAPTEDEVWFASGMYDVSANDASAKMIEKSQQNKK